MAKALGIDLGTTNSCMAVVEAGEPTVVTNAEGARITPSVVAFSKTGEIMVGEVAKRQAVTNPENTVYSIKRFMGRQHNEVAAERKLVPYSIKKGKNGKVGLGVGDKTLTPEELSAKILQKLKSDAESYLGEAITKAVITVPAYFNDAQRTATKDAGVIAGLEVLRIINEPTAAALAYGLDKEEEGLILVFDLGGGTFDVSVLEIGEGVFEVKATSGDNHLGGDDWDHKIIDWLIEDFKNKYGIDLSEDRMAIQRLREGAEKAKIELSSVLETTIHLPFITADQSGPKHLEAKLTRSQFEQMTEDLLARCRGPLEQAMKDAGVASGALQQVILVGGATRMPMVQKLVTELAGKEPRKDINPDEVVAVGAGIQAGVLMGDVKEVLLLDVTPLSLGIETKGGVLTPIIERNTTIPTKKSEIFTTAEDSQTSVEVHVLQGERPMAQDNKTLGRFHLVGIPSAPRGIPQIEVTFDIDANGIVHVTAKDMATSKEQAITVSGATALNKDEIDEMVQEAEAHGEDDRRKKELAELRNNADSLVYTTEKSVKEAGDKLGADDKQNIEEAAKEVKEALKGDDTEKIQAATERLTQASHKVAEVLYAQAKAQGAESGPAGPAGDGETAAEPKEEAVDADYEVVDEDDKGAK